MKKLYFLVSILLVGSSVLAQTNLVKYVKPIIGTERMGHTFPGATVPFGMVQLSPDTDTIPYAINGQYNPDVYQYCAGYQYGDKTIVGFSHTHFNGTGHSDLGDISIMPTTGPLMLNPGQASKPEGGFRSAFSHQYETAEAAYYKVKLDSYNITAELTATNRVGFHQYTFPASDQSHIILDLMASLYNYPDKNVWTFVQVVNDTLVTGYRQTRGWANTRTVYFAISFSKPFESYGSKDFGEKETYQGFWGKFDRTKNFPELAARQLRMHFDFKTTEGEKIKLKVALSPVSTQGAISNLEVETPHWDFEKIKQKGQALWNRELSKIKVEMNSIEEKESFYTAMYHTFINPTTYMDVDGQYKGLDKNRHRAEDFVNYTTFSLWDTYRALHPFFNIVQPRRNNDMIKSMLEHYDQSVYPLLPVWSHYANENWCMIGYHGVSLIADAIVKDVGNFNYNKALDACIATARFRNYDGLGYYMDLGYVPEDKNTASVSKTLEYAYDDWCIARAAHKLNRMDVYEEFIKRSEYYRNVYDATVGFMRPKLSDGTWQAEFDPLDMCGQGFIEGNAWNYSLYVPHQPEAMIELMGGKEVFAKHLEKLFTMELPDKYFENIEDITRDGIIGNYVHGNEPSHHVPYLFNYCDRPWKTQETVRMILKKMYKSTPDGLGGNDDCGQMSAWYLFSSLGFYPMAPGSQMYQIGSPAVKSAQITLEGGKIFTIEAKNQNDKNVYVQEVLLNGKPITNWLLPHRAVVDGGHLTFVMGSKPNTKS